MGRRCPKNGRRKLSNKEHLTLSARAVPGRPEKLMRAVQKIHASRRRRGGARPGTKAYHARLWKAFSTR